MKRQLFAILARTVHDLLLLLEQLLENALVLFNHEHTHIPKGALLEVRSETYEGESYHIWHVEAPELLCSPQDGSVSAECHAVAYLLFLLVRPITVENLYLFFEPLL